MSLTMKKKLLIAMAIVSTLSALPAMTHAGNPDQGRPAQEMKEGEKKERHPEMMRALRALEDAKKALEKAAHDFGGHRAKALEHTEAAIKEVKEGLQYDKK